MSGPALSAPPLSERRFTLATDLDGTFLGGTQEDRAALYSWIEENRDTVGLVFVTGRDLDFIVELCARRGLPWPDYVIGDVGTTIARSDAANRTIRPIAQLEAEIAERWRDSGDKVRAALHGAPGLTLQQTPFRYRVSYDLAIDAYDPAAAQRVEALGLDHLISDDRFFDVLPKGVSKGPSLRRLVEHLSIPQTGVLAAGDTLNDLSMLVCGLPAVAVGNSEPALMEKVGHLETVFPARGHGAAGIMEAINALALHEIPERA